MKAKKIHVYVFRSDLGDCTMNGVSSKARSLDLHAEGNPDGAEDGLVVVTRMIAGREYVHAEPIRQPKGLVGPMAGGNFVYTSDSRYSEVTGVQYPISVHDRFETQEQYDALTR